MAENQIAKLMRALGCTEQEARDLIEYDKEVDKASEKTKLAHDLPEEKAKVAKKIAKVTEHKKPITFDKKKRERKPNEVKGAIITALNAFLNENTEIAFENVEIANKERQIAFKVGENRFELTLVQKREPKN